MDFFNCFITLKKLGSLTVRKSGDVRPLALKETIVSQADNFMSRLCFHPQNFGLLEQRL